MLARRPTWEPQVLFLVHFTVGTVKEEVRVTAPTMSS